MMNENEGMDFTAYLPQEIHREIFSFLRPQDLGRASLVSRNWRSVANDDALWKKLCSESSIREEYFPSHVTPICEESYAEGNFDMEPQCKWASIYRLYHTTLTNNWLAENYRKIEAPSYTENVIVFDSFIILTLFNVPIVIVFKLIRGEYKVIQRIRLNIFVECSVQACANSKILILSACNSSFLYYWDGSQFVFYKTLFLSDDPVAQGLSVSDDPWIGFNPTLLLTCCTITNEFIWMSYEPSVLEIYDHSLIHRISVSCDVSRRITNSGRRVFIKSLNDIKVYLENGDFLVSYVGDFLECSSFNNRFFSFVEKRGIRVAICVNLTTSSQFTLKLSEPIFVELDSEDDTVYCLHFISPDRFALSKFDCRSEDHLWTSEFLFNPRFYFIARKYILLRYKTRDMFLCSGTGKTAAALDCPSNQWYLSEKHYDSRVVVKKLTSHGRIKFFICNYFHF